jgi:hypothetical protein
VRCEAALFGVDVPTALRVAACESGFRWWESYAGHDGTWQQAERYWWERYVSYGARSGGFFRSVMNSRTNTVVSMWMVLNRGWARDWACF